MPLNGPPPGGKEPPRLTIEHGIEILLQVEGVPNPFSSMLLGLKPGTYLIMEIPGRPSLDSRLVKGSKVTGLYFQAGSVFGFETTLIGRTDKPFRVMFLEYPWVVESQNLRQNERFCAYLPARVRSGWADFYGALLDVSQKGCRFFCASASSEDGPGFRGSERVEVSLKFFGAAIELTLEGKVRNLEHDRGVWILGVEFTTTDADRLKVLESYIKTVARANTAL